MFALCSQYLPQNLNTAEDLLVGGSRVIEAEGIRGSVHVAIEGCTGNDGYLVSQRFGNEFGQISALGKRTPEEETSLGTGILNILGEMLVHSVKHQITLATVKIADLVKMRQILVAGNEALADHLAENIGVNVLDLLCNDHLGHNRSRSAEESDSHTGGKHLGI